MIEPLIGSGLNCNVPQDVISRAQNGSPEDIGWLYSCYHQNIYRYLYYRTGDLQAAEDLTANVFLKMIQALPAYRIEATPFIAWLFQIARNVAIDNYRRRAAHPLRQLSEMLVDTQDEPAEQAELHLDSVELARAISRLEETQRDVILLRFIESLPIAETAIALHKTEDAVKALQRRGLKQLRILLDHREQDGR
jgi:RNA polymerase sigma-70 factor (ECF subfamily)